MPAEPNSVVDHAEATRAQGQAPPLKRRRASWGFFGG